MAIQEKIFPQCNWIEDAEVLYNTADSIISRIVDFKLNRNHALIDAQLEFEKEKFITDTLQFLAYLLENYDKETE